jgi:uncharacterized membrane protein
MADATTRSDDGPVAASKKDQAAEARAEIGDAAGAQVTARAVTISKPVAEVYRVFRDFSNLPSFMENVVSIDLLDDKRSHWVVKAPGGRTVEWDARVTDEAPDRYIAWESEPGADVPNAGRVDFRDAGARGTVVTATITYDPPMGFIGKVVAKMFQREPAIQARRDLNRFKQWLETGEIATPAKTRKEHEEMGL